MNEPSLTVDDVFAGAKHILTTPEIRKLRGFARREMYCQLIQTELDTQKQICDSLASLTGEPWLAAQEKFTESLRRIDELNEQLELEEKGAF